MRFLTLILISLLSLMLLTLGCSNAPETEGDSTEGEAITPSEPEGETDWGNVDWENTPTGEIVLSILPEITKKFPGTVPDGWPDDYVVMEGFAIDVGNVYDDGTLEVVAYGGVTLEAVEAFYTNPKNMPGWKDVSTSQETLESGVIRTEIKLERDGGECKIIIFQKEDNENQLSLRYKSLPSK